MKPVPRTAAARAAEVDRITSVLGGHCSVYTVDHRRDVAEQIVGPLPALKPRRVEVLGNYGAKHAVSYTAGAQFPWRLHGAYEYNYRSVADLLRAHDVLDIPDETAALLAGLPADPFEPWQSADETLLVTLIESEIGDAIAAHDGGEPLADVKRRAQAVAREFFAAFPRADYEIVELEPVVVAYLHKESTALVSASSFPHLVTPSEWLPLVYAPSVTP